jgi:hypothetical protein
MATTTFLIASLVATAVGAGVSAYGQYQAGRTQSAIANYNALQRQKQARMELLAMQAQASATKNQAALTRAAAEGNYALRAAEANARFQNADLMDKRALQEDAINRLNIRNKRMEFGALQSEQRAAIADSGVVESTGTPLDILAETAGKIQAEQETMQYENELSRRTLFREADLERLGGRLGLAGAALDRSSQVAQAGLMDDEAKLRQFSAKAAYQSGMREADIMRFTGRANRRASTLQAGATLFSGATSAFSTGNTFRTA